ncbi:MAG TPA: hypothetical protein VF062_07930 [Candidatus Limnocylindrales bacterium]
MIGLVFDASALVAYASVEDGPAARGLTVAELLHELKEDGNLAGVSVLSAQAAWEQLGKDGRRLLRDLVDSRGSVIALLPFTSENLWPILELADSRITSELAHAAMATDLYNVEGGEVSLATFEPELAKLVIGESAVIDLDDPGGDQAGYLSAD